MKRFFATLTTLTLLFTACGSNGATLPENFSYEGGSNDQLSFTYSLEYPSDFTLNEDMGLSGETVSFEQDGAVIFQIATKMIGVEDITPVFMEQSPTGSVEVDGMQAQEYVFPDGMCNEEGQCSPPVTVVRFMKGIEPPLQQFLFVVYGQTELTEPYLSILGSLQTVEKNSLENTEDTGEEEDTSGESVNET